MKKAKEPDSFVNKAADIISLFKNFTGGNKDKSENAKSSEEEKIPDKKQNGQNYNSPQGVPSLPPHDYGTNVFRKIIENHDRAVKNIMKKNKKDD